MEEVDEYWYEFATEEEREEIDLRLQAAESEPLIEAPSTPQYHYLSIPNIDEIEPANTPDGPRLQLKHLLGREPTEEEIDEYYVEKFKSKSGEGTIRTPDTVQEHNEFNRDIPSIIHLSSPISPSTHSHNLTDLPDTYHEHTEHNREIQGLQIMTAPPTERSRRRTSSRHSLQNLEEREEEEKDPDMENYEKRALNN